MAFALSFCAGDSGAAGSGFFAFDAAAAAAVPYGFADCAGVLAGVLSLVDMVGKKCEMEKAVAQRKSRERDGGW